MSCENKSHLWPVLDAGRIKDRKGFAKGDSAVRDSGRSMEARRGLWRSGEERKRRVGHGLQNATLRELGAVQCARVSLCSNNLTVKLALGRAEGRDVDGRTEKSAVARTCCDGGHFRTGCIKYKRPF